jgi:hypothetical protein
MPTAVRLPGLFSLGSTAIPSSRIRTYRTTTKLSSHPVTEQLVFWTDFPVLNRINEELDDVQTD